jgi:catechol 2,3-dioxygenase-like lactoylglutathione lyase family enzyme
MGEIELGWPVWIGVVTDDLEAQQRFYRDVLGLRELEAGDDWVQFDLGERRKLELLARSDLPQYDQPRVQVGFAVTDIRAAAAELQARGVERISEIEGGPDSGQYWCYFRDPEGNVFELAQRLPAVDA